MANRLTDTDKWKKPWFRKLKPIHKCFWQYICDNCDHAGIWEVDFELAEVFIGATLDIKEIKEVFNKQYMELSQGKKWLLKDFVSFQYKKGLNPDNRVHASVIAILKKEGATKGLQRPLQGCKDKDKDKDKKLDKDKDKDFTDFCAKLLEDWNTLAGAYDNLPKIQALSIKRKDHLKARFNEPAFVEFWPKILEAFKDSPWLRGDKEGQGGSVFKGGFDWIIANDNNYLKVIEGKYGEPKKDSMSKWEIKQ